MKVFTTGQVAKICKVAPRTVSKWFDSGRLKGYRIPGSQDRRIPREYLIKFLKEHGMPLGDLEDEAMAKVLIVAQDQILIENLRRASATANVNSKSASQPAASRPASKPRASRSDCTKAVFMTAPPAAQKVGPAENFYWRCPVVTLRTPAERRWRGAFRG